MFSKVVGAVLMVAGIAGCVWLVGEELRYLEPAELDRKPYPMRNVDLSPIEAKGGIEYFGKLKMRIYIRKSGDVDHVDVVQASLPAPVVEKAVKAFAETRWEPGMRAGRGRRSVNVVEVDFEPPVRDLDRPLSSPAS